MFSNTYQSGHYLEVWDSRVNPEKNTSYKHLCRKIPSSLKNFYDKDVKSYIYEIEGNNRLIFPSEDRQQLSLHQRYLVLQIYVPVGANWSLELGINDLQAQKKRINITTNTGKQELKYFSFRYPLENQAIERGIWSFLAVDLYSFCNAFKNTVFRSLDHIVIHGECKMRRIFTMREWVEWEIPKAYWLSMNLQQTLQLIEFKEEPMLLHHESVVNNSSKSHINNFSIAHSKMIESRIEHIPSVQKKQGAERLSNSPIRNSPIRNSVGINNGSQNNKSIKLPEVNIKSQKETTPLKSSKLSEKVQSLRNQYSKEFSLGKSNRSLTKADLVIEKSKVRLNSLQAKEEEILNSMKYEEQRLSDKITNKEKKMLSIKAPKKTDNIFKPKEFQSEFSDSNPSHIKLTANNSPPKGIKIVKKFQEDNIFREQSSYSSSFSRKSYLESHQSNRVIQKASQMSERNESELLLKEQSVINNSNFSKNKDSKVSKHSTVNNRAKDKEEIIEEDVWTEESNEEVDNFLKPQTPIEEIIADETKGNSRVGNVSEDRHPQPVVREISIPGQTVISREGSKPIVIRKKSIIEASQNELELIYDEMVGCYYHPQTNTYYQIKD